MPKLHEELEFSICMVATYINVSLYLQSKQIRNKWKFTCKKRKKKRDRQIYMYVYIPFKSTNKTTQEEEDISAKQVMQTTRVAEQAVDVDEQQGKKKKMRVMVAIDGSEGSFYALKWALDLLLVGPKENADDVATSTRTETLEAPHAGSHESVSMVTLVYVMQPFQNYVLPAAGSAELRKEQEERAASILARALEICRDKMIKAETLILRGEPKDMICEATEQMHVDLLVVGSRGLGMVKRAFIGSVSDYCAHHAKCPVVIVKPPKESGKPSKESGKK